MTKRELFLANARGEWTEKTPVWLMRQAGRYMADYRRIRQDRSFEGICRTPHLAAEVTLQPLRAFDFDAAIIFSDILFILEPLGISLKYDPGPVLEPYLESPDQASKYRAFDAAGQLEFVGRALVETRRQLGPDVALLGFSGAPFTLFCYLCGTRGHFGLYNAVKFLTRYPAEAQRVLDILTDAVADYLIMQAENGADAVQIFDTWAGELSEEEFDIWSKPGLETIIDRLRIRGIISALYIRGAYQLLDKLSAMKHNIASLDWKTPPAAAMSKLKGKTLQGNLDPALMLGPGELVGHKVQSIMREMQEYPGYIFNLGHGILPDTPEENVRVLVQSVREFKRCRQLTPITK